MSCTYKVAAVSAAEAQTSPGPMSPGADIAGGLVVLPLDVIGTVQPTVACKPMAHKSAQTWVIQTGAVTRQVQHKAK